MPQATNSPAGKHFPSGSLVPTLASAKAIMVDSSLPSDLELKEQLLKAIPPSIAVEIVSRLAERTTRETPLLLRINATNVSARGLAPRHNASFVSKAFATLQESIRSTNGNQQPVLIQVINQGLEIVFGHRRHKACLDLGLPLLAMVWGSDLTEAEAFTHLERENEHRASLSVYEKGRLFRALVNGGVFRSYRDLADHIHMSHAGVNAVVKVANLHELVIKAFGDPCTITTKYAEEISKAWDADCDAILGRAKELCETPPQKQLSPKKTLEYLLRSVPETPWSVPLVIEKPHLGTWEKTKDGQVLVRLPGGTDTTMINAISCLVNLADSHHDIQTAKPNIHLPGGNRASS